MPLFRGIPTDPATLVSNYQAVRKETEKICAPLEIEDYVLQAMPDASPPRWHLGHVSWFFEAFLLKPNQPDFKLYNPAFHYLFNSYYNSAGPQFTRAKRGHLSRPTVKEVYKYRAYVDDAMLSFIESSSPEQLGETASLIALGLNHEQQHQELLFTDMKYNFSVNPLKPAYHQTEIPRANQPPPFHWIHFQGGLQEIGHDGNGFAFDNEGPRHQVYLRPYQLASRLTTNGEYLEFMETQGYQRPTLWLSEGWKTVQERGWKAPLYWELIDGKWYNFTLSGMKPVDENAPVVHVSYYEADAYARWKSSRLPTEQEWEHASSTVNIDGNFMDSGIYNPVPQVNTSSSALQQMFGDLWEWTQSPYSPYPGFKPWEGGVGEYNGKFMVNQMVLRGGSCATPANHIRASYRNFFPPDAQWQFSGIRLAKDA